MNNEKSFEAYLNKKHLDDCIRVGRRLTESEWVSDLLNVNQPQGEGLAYVSVNQWMHGGRNPDGKNMIRLIRIFGPEIMPYLGIELPQDLAKVIGRWDKMSPKKREEILQILENPEKESMEV